MQGSDLIPNRCPYSSTCGPFFVCFQQQNKEGAADKDMPLYWCMAGIYGTFYISKWYD